MHQRGVFVDPPDQPVTHGDRLAGPERHQAFAAAQGDAVLDERGVAVQANTVGVLQGFIRIPGHAAAHVLTQFVQAHHPVLEKVVVLDIGVIQRHDTVQIPVFPAQVVTHHRLARGLGLQRTIIIGVHRGLDEKKPSLPKFCPGFNGQSRG